jgi:hypothetical protein
MRENFSMNVMNNDIMRNDHVRNYGIEISSDDFERCCKYLHALVDKVKYNYSDAFITMPIHEYILPDVFFQVCVF